MERQRHRARHGPCALVVLALLGSCIEASLVPCGDQLCAVGSTCVGGNLCATPDQIAACDGIAQGETCAMRGGVGRCETGVCVATGCGNGVVDPGEACDDGNAVSGDGCRGDCNKLEMCGDAILDGGEGCDDGNTNPVDGCDACIPTTWRATALIGGNLAATSVGLSFPNGVAIDRQGNLYIADTDDERIRRVDATGIVTTIAGTGSRGYGGDGAAATSAKLADPWGVAVDGLGNVYIADSGNHRVRRVDPAGIITTVAGTGAPGYSGNGGPATSAMLGFPRGIALDGLGALYISDGVSIRRVDPSGVITTIAGTGTSGFSVDGGAATSAQLNGVIGVALDGAGNIYIAEEQTQRIRCVDTNGIITTVAGTGVVGYSGDGGPATSAALYNPRGVAVDAAGNLYIGDAHNQCVRRVSPTGIITTFAGGTYGFAGDGGAATSARMSYPSAIALDALGNVYAADAGNNRIRRVDTNGIITTVAGTAALGYTGDGGAATGAVLGLVPAVAVDAVGNLYVADGDNSLIRRVDPMGVITTFAGTGTSGDGGDGGPATSAQIDFPYCVAADALGNVYIADTNNRRIRRVDPSGIMTTVAGTGVGGYNGDGGPAASAQLSSLAKGVAADGLGNLYIADSGNSRVRRVDPTGVITTVAGTGTGGFGGDGGAATSALLGSPNAVAVDGSGNLYIADNARIRRVDSAGIITTVAGGGALVGSDGDAAIAINLDQSRGVAVDGIGRLYILDSGGRVVRVNTTGTITIVGGGGIVGYTGDGGPAIEAQLTAPSGIAVDALGNVYVADMYGRAVRRVDTAGRITTAVGLVDPEGTGPFAQAHLADPTAVALTPSFALFAGGSSGTVEVTRTSTPWLGVAIGRYPQQTATGALARFRDQNFGTISGVAYDASAGVVYLTESTANRLHVVTVVDAADVNTWTIATLNTDTGGGFADGAVATAKFRTPTGLYFDAAAHQLYIADTGNHVVRAIDLSNGTAGATVRTVAGTPQTRGYFGDGGPATTALLYAPRAITRCNGDLFVADTSNQRVRRIAATTNLITTVLGDGVAASSGEGMPASAFPVNRPSGLACDAIGNLFVTSTTAVRLVPADAAGVVDGTGTVQTIYGAPPRDAFPASVTTCLTGLAVVDGTTIEVVDSCTGLLVELRRSPGAM